MRAFFAGRALHIFCWLGTSERERFLPLSPIVLCWRSPDQIALTGYEYACISGYLFAF